MPLPRNYNPCLATRCGVYMKKQMKRSASTGGGGGVAFLVKEARIHHFHVGGVPRDVLGVLAGGVRQVGQGPSAGGGSLRSSGRVTRKLTAPQAHDAGSEPAGASGDNGGRGALARRSAGESGRRAASSVRPVYPG
ncbi:hypothetical protein LX36DRAFT_402909 [Colletotrichum falcatum]|nr:hypothetical protein LX36DRAFT_402909 [Colletotrichum falcatum]